MRNPVTGEDHFLIGLLPTGLFTKSEEFFSAKNFRVAVNGFEFNYPGRNAILAASTWRGPTPPKPHPRGPARQRGVPGFDYRPGFIGRESSCPPPQGLPTEEPRANRA